MAPRRTHAGGLESGGAASHHHHLSLGTFGRRNDVGHGRLPPRRRVMDAERLIALRAAVDAVACADAWPYGMLASLRDLLDDIRIGNVRACHADEIENTFGDRMPGGGDVGDPASVDQRGLADVLAELADLGEPGS